MKHLEALLATIMAALGRLGSGTARREADQEIVRVAEQGMRMADEIVEANTSDFARASEEWKGVPPEPRSPREDPHHGAKALMGRVAERYLLGLKLVFWVVFGPAYFAVLAWLAVTVAVAISVTLSLGVKPLVAALILKPGLTRHQQERRLHAHVVGGIIAFALAFGGLFVLRGLGGPLALIGATLVMPVLSACDLVLLYLMGIGHAFAQLYGWAAPFVRKHHNAAALRAKFEGFHLAARSRLAAVLLMVALLGAGIARAQVPVGQSRIANLHVDSTVSIYASAADTMTPIIVQSFISWSEQIGATAVRVSAVERDGWLPRTVYQTGRKPTPQCTARRTDGSIFRGISEAEDQQARDGCDRARTTDVSRITAEVTKALADAWHAPPLVDPRRGHSCTAFLDLLARTARAPVGNLHVIVSDTEETCSNVSSAVPRKGGGAEVIIILMPSRTDMGPGVSAAARFNAKRTHVERIAPWVRVILAPADVELYRLSDPTPLTPNAGVTSRPK